MVLCFLPSIDNPEGPGKRQCDSPADSRHGTRGCSSPRFVYRSERIRGMIAVILRGYTVGAFACCVSVAFLGSWEHAADVHSCKKSSGYYAGP